MQLIKRSRLRLAAVALAAGVSPLALAIPANASQTPAVDRGLPTANLNNAAGSDRSNVAWSNGNDYISGDTFSVGSAGQTWVVSGIRTWNIGELGVAFGDQFSNDTLYLGTGAVSPVETGTVAPGSDADSNPNITHTAVTYADGSNYQGSSGDYLQIWQNDFTHLDYVVSGGQTQFFAVDGTVIGPIGYWFNHASNAALSGSPQQGADNLWVAWSKSDLSTPNYCNSAGGTGVCDGGWDKSSDINVQVFASQVATSKDACKKGGWESLVSADGSSFKNQGDCIQYVNTGR
jgi:hypothetical protein